MRKYVKLFAFALFTFLLSSMSVSAREMTIEELGEEASKIQSDAGYVYILGEYAFTSNYTIHQEDIIIASSSLNLKDPTDLSQAVIYQIVRQRDENYQPTGWQEGPDVLGTKDLPEKVNVKWIDMKHRVLEKSDATINLNINDSKFSAYTKILEEKLHFQFNEAYDKGQLTYENGVISGLLLQNTKITLSEDDENKFNHPKYFFAYVLEVPNATSETKITTSVMGRTEELKWEEFDVTDNTEEKKPGIVVLVPVDPEEWKNDSTLTITIDLDGDKGEQDEYESTTYQLDLSGLRFQEDSKMDFTTENLPPADVESISNDWGYTKSTSDTYKLEPVADSVNKYQLTGIIVEQKIGEDVFPEDEETGYYFLLSVGQNIAPELYHKATVTYPGNKATKTSTIADATGVTILFSTSDTNKKTPIKITVDLDGDGNEYFPIDYEIDLSSVTLEKTSKFSVTKELPSSAAENIKKQFQSWGFKPEDLEDFATYKNGFNIAEVDSHHVEISGLLPYMKLSTKDGFGEDAQKNNGYYFFYVIKTDVTKQNHDNLTVTVPQNGEGMYPTKVVKANAFDTENELAILMQLNPNLEDKHFKVIVDMDGEGTEYAPYEIVFDYTKVDFQQETTASFDLAENKVPEEDAKTLTSWGYQFPNNIPLSEDNQNHTKENLTLADGKLSGTVKEQKLTGGGFGDDSDSYFFTYTIEPNVVTDTIQVTITDVVGTTTYDIHNFTLNSEGKKVLTILHHIPLNKKDEDNKKIKIIIDADGEEDKHYTKEEYELDYDQVDFVELHDVKINDNNEKTTETIPIYDGEKLSVLDNPVKEKHDKDDHQYHTFDHWNKQTNGNPDAEIDTEFEFENGKSKDAITEDVTLYPIWEIDVNQYITDALTHINQKESIQDMFQIEATDDNNLNVEILDRTKKLTEVTDTAIASTIAHALASGEIEVIEFTLGDNEKEFRANGETEESKIKEQVIKNLREFFNAEVDGNTDSNKTLNDLYQKWQEESDKHLNISISPTKTAAKIKDQKDGAAMIYHVSIEEELMVNFKAGSLKNPDTIYVKTGSSLDNLPTPEIPEMEKSYRTFDGWYQESNQVQKLTDITKDETLTAHYSLNIEKFVEDVVKDLDSEDETYSDNFTGKFDVTKNKNTITINITNPNVKLTELAHTSIPGAIAYILQKGEIKEITLTVDGQTVTYNSQYKNSSKEYTDESERELLDDTGKALKEEIVKGAKEVFDQKLNNQEATLTLDQLEYAKKSFTIQIGDVEDDTIQLVDNNGEKVTLPEEKTYTFQFDCDFAVVNKDHQDNLGAKLLEDALTNSNNYSTIYIESDIELDNTLTISDKTVTIESIEAATGIRAIDASNTTISVKNQKDYVIDVQSGNVTISDLKITGGKKAELKVEDGAVVTLDNVDVSGNIEKSQASPDSDEMHASIIVKGTLTASNIQNDKETYELPTIAVVNSYEYRENAKDSVHGEEEMEDPSGHLSDHAVVTASQMTVNDKYNIIEKESKPGIDKIAETYYGSFYYIDQTHSQIYYAGIMDHYKESDSPYDYFKVYYYGDSLDFPTLGDGYTADVTRIESNGKSYIFKNFNIKDGKQGIAGTEKVQELLHPHTTNVIYVHYEQEPSSVLTVQNANGLSTEGNLLSGTLMKAKDEDGKFYIPVTLTSELFEDNKTTFTVVDPNNHETNYVYSSSSQNGIVQVSTSKTMKLELEAIKSSNITTDNGKKYTILVDIDGNADEYQKEIYEVDYSQVDTIVEKINKAAKNTQDANSLTMVKDNKIKGREEKFTYMYDKTKDVTLLTTLDNSLTEYSFRLKNVDSSHEGPIIISLHKKTENYSCTQEPCPPVLNDWVFANFFTQSTKGSHEITLLQDLIKNKETIEALKSVEAVANEAHAYKVTLNTERLNAWLDNAYLDNEKEADNSNQTGTEVTLKVVLDDQEKHLVSFQTESTFDLTNSSGTYKGNKLNVTFSNVGETVVAEPLTYLETTLEQIQTFYNQCKDYHRKTGGGEIQG